MIRENDAHLFRFGRLPFDTRQSTTSWGLHYALTHKRYSGMIHHQLGLADGSGPTTKRKQIGMRDGT